MVTGQDTLRQTPWLVALPRSRYVQSKACSAQGMFSPRVVQGMFNPRLYFQDQGIFSATSATYTKQGSTGLPPPAAVPVSAAACGLAAPTWRYLMPMTPHFLSASFSKAHTDRSRCWGGGRWWWWWVGVETYRGSVRSVSASTE